MQSERKNTPCPAESCVYNVDQRCLHALRPSPHNCEYRHARRQMPTEGLVTFSRFLCGRIVPQTSS